MTTKTVEQMFEGYIQACFPAGTSMNSVQFRETRQAFYAGAWALFHEFIRITGEKIPEAEMEKKFAKLLAEMQVFLQPKNKG